MSIPDHTRGLMAERFPSSGTSEAEYLVGSFGGAKHLPPAVLSRLIARVKGLIDEHGLYEQSMVFSRSSALVEAACHINEERLERRREETEKWALAEAESLFD